jgi:hypothetical protein
VFVHGLWLLPSSWDRWADLFEKSGFAALTPGWPDDPETVEEAKAEPEVFADLQNECQLGLVHRKQRRRNHDQKNEAEDGETDVELEADDQIEGDDGADTDEDGDEPSGEESGDGDADSGQDDDERGHEGDSERPDKVKQSRGNRDYGALRRRAREAEERAARAEAKAEEALRTVGGRQSEDARRAESERLALMGPDEKLEFYREQDKRENERRFQGLAFQVADSSDRAAFESKCARTPALAAVADEVEKVLADERRQGRAGATRETIAAYVIGKKALANAGRAKGKQAKRAEQNRSSQTARPGGGRSNVSGSSDRRGSESDRRKKRLEDLNI